MTGSDCESRLAARGFGIKPGLERMNAVVDLLDNPQLTYPTVHVAGTNGKSSTAWILGTILGAQGLKTGVYTSPHLESLTERFLLYGPEENGVDASVMTHQECGQMLDYLTPFAELVEEQSGEQLTYFEMTTLMAFEWMAEKTVSAGIFEAGLGGRWDATNLIDGRVAILTDIAVDHQEFLGSTPLANASEKVDIIKEGAWVVSGGQDPDVARLLEETVKSRGASLRLLGRDFRLKADAPAVGGRLVTVETRYTVYPDLFLPLFGGHQSRNLALAIAAAESFLDRELHHDSLRAAVARAASPGRLEIVRRDPLVVLDGAHNPHAAGALAAALPDAFGPRPVILVVSVFQDKDAAGILEFLVPLAVRMIFTRSTSPRAADPSRLAEAAGALGADAEVIDDLSAALEAAISSCEQNAMVVVTGSLQAVGEARELLVEPEGRPQ